MDALNQIAIPELYVSSEAAAKLREEGEKLPGWELTPSQVSDLELLMNGGFFPLKGFMTQADCDAVAQGMRLSSGAIWPMPVVLDVSDEFAARVQPGDDIALNDGEGVSAILSVTDRWKPEGESARLGGKVKGIRPPRDAGASPNRWRAIFRERDLEHVIGHFDKGPDGGDRLHLFADEVDAPLTTIPVTVDSLPDTPQRRDVLQGLLARNYGATHIPNPTNPTTGELLKEIGLNLSDSAPTGS